VSKYSMSIVDDMRERLPARNPLLTAIYELDTQKDIELFCREYSEYIERPGGWREYIRKFVDTSATTGSIAIDHVHSMTAFARTRPQPVSAERVRLWDESAHRLWGKINKTYCPE